MEKIDIDKRGWYFAGMGVEKVLPKYRDPRERYFHRITEVNGPPGSDQKWGVKVCPMYAEVMACAKLVGVSFKDDEYCGLSEAGHYQDGSPRIFISSGDVQVVTACEDVRERLGLRLELVNDAQMANDLTKVGEIVEIWRRCYAEDNNLTPSRAELVSVEQLVGYASEQLKKLPNFGKDVVAKCNQRPKTNSLF